MLVSAPATAALDALLVSLAPALGGAHPETPTTAAFQNVLHDLTLLEDEEASGNAKQQSAAIPDPASKKQPLAAASPIDVTAAPQAAGIMPPQARLTLSPTGLPKPPDEDVTPSAAPPSSPLDDSGPGLPLHDSGIAVATPATPPATAPVAGSADSPAPIAKSSTNPSALARVSLGTAAAQAAISEAPNGPTSPIATTASPLENLAAPSKLVVAPSQVPSAAPISNPTPPVASSPRQSKAGERSATIHGGQEFPHIIDQQKSSPSATTQTTKNSPQAGQSAPVAPLPITRNKATAAPGRPAPSTVSPGAMATLPPPVNPDVPSANVNPTGTPAVGSGQSIAPSQQAPAKLSTSALVPPTQPSPQFAPGVPSVIAPSATSNFLTAPVPVAPTLTQAPQAQAAMPAVASPAAPNLDQAAEVQAKAMPTSTVTSATTAAPAREPISRPATDRTGQPTAPLSSQNELAGAIPAAKSPLLPQAENFAFALRLLGLDDAPSHAPLTEPGTSSAGNGELPLTQTLTPSSAQSLTQPVTQPKQPAPQQDATAQGQNADQQNASQQNANQAVRETQPVAPAAGKPEAVAQGQPEVSAALRTVQQSHPGDAMVFQISQPAPQVGSTPGLDRGASAESHVLLTAQEARLGGAELPRSSASSEILLHLTGDGQSAAAIRVADRAGAVNVSVHAADPVLRESLKTNLADLSAQLNTQGWKTETTKSTPVPAHSDNPQDSHAGGQRGSGQQSSGDGRQPQRERRGNSSQWRQAFDQQITGNETHPGGKR